MEERVGTNLPVTPVPFPSLSGPHCGLGLACVPDVTGACLSRRLRFWSLEFESQSFLYRQVGSVLGPPRGRGGAQATVAVSALGCRYGG